MLEHKTIQSGWFSLLSKESLYGHLKVFVVLTPGSDPCLIWKSWSSRPFDTSVPAVNWTDFVLKDIHSPCYSLLFAQIFWFYETSVQYSLTIWGVHTNANFSSQNIWIYLGPQLVPGFMNILGTEKWKFFGILEWITVCPSPLDPASAVSIKLLFVSYLLLLHHSNVGRSSHRPTGIRN